MADPSPKFAIDLSSGLRFDGCPLSIEPRSHVRKPGGDHHPKRCSFDRGRMLQRRNTGAQIGRSCGTTNACSASRPLSGTCALSCWC